MLYRRVRLNIFTIGIAYFVFNVQNAVCQKPCSKVNISVAESELRKLPETGPMSLYGDIYAVREGIERITINCSRPALSSGWTAVVGKGYVGKVNSSFHVQIDLVDDGSASTKFYRREMCHTASITFEDFGESITGSYSCGNRDTIYIFGGKNLNSESFLWSGHRFTKGSFEIREEMDRYGYGRHVALPCAQKYPGSVMLQFESYDGSKTESFVQGASNHFYFCREQFFCVNLNMIMNEIGKSIHDGFTLTCKGTHSTNTKDTVVINTPPAPDLTVIPKESFVNLAVIDGYRQRFSCHSVNPVQIETDYNHENIIVANETLDEYYKHKSAIDVVLPEKDWENVHINVFCKDQQGNQLHKWHYGFTRLLPASENKSYPEIPMEASGNLNITTQQLMNGHCTSLDPKSAKVYFLPCSTYIECKMKAPLLFLPRSQQLQTTPLRTGVKFELSSNSSGMIRCVGFQKDISVILFPTVDEKSFTHHALRNETGQGLDFNDPIVTINKTQIYQGDFIRAQCKIPLMLLISHPLWEISYSNGSKFIIPTANLLESKTEIISEIYTVSTTINVESTDIIGVGCQSVLIGSVRHIVWKNGIPLYKLSLFNNDVTPVVRKGLKRFDVYANNLALKVMVPISILLILAVMAFVWWYRRKRSQYTDPATSG